MKIFLIYLTWIFILSAMLLTSGCGSGESHPKASDSIYSTEYLNSIAIDNPERALALLDTVEQKNLLSKFDIARFRCLAYHNGLSDYKNALRYGLEAYDMPESRQDAEIFLLLLGVIADDYYQNGNYEESVRICTEGLKLASDSLLIDQEANFYVSLATNLLELGRKDEAYLKLGKAADILEKEAARSRLYMTADDYVYSLGVYIQSLCSDKRYRDAIAMMPRYEQAMDCLESKDDIPDGLVDMRRASAYGAFAYMLALEGDNRKADELYRKLLETDYSKSPYRGQLIVPYLLARKRYAEALSYLQDEKDYWQANADTLSYDYIDCHLKREQEAFSGLNKTAEALRVANTIQQMSDILRERERSAKALELAEIYKTQEQALQLEQQSASILIRNIIIGSALIFLILAVVFIIRILRYNKTINNKNKVMVKTIDELIGYKDELFERQVEVLQLRKKLDEAKKKTDIEAPLTETVEKNEESASSETPEKSDSLLTEGDKILYIRMNHEVQARKLYLNPNFSRKDLMAEFKISANKFSMLFKEFAGCTFSQYIQNCRLDYAVKLMRENPQWNFDAIAKEAQMSNGAFYSHFKRRFGMSPSDFKAGKASISSQYFRLLSLLLVLMMASSCSKNDDPVTNSPQPQIIFLFSPGGLGDMSYNDCILEGVQRFKLEQPENDIYIYSPESLDEAEKIFSDWLVRPESNIPVLFVLATSDYEPIAEKYLKEYNLTANKSILLFESRKRYSDPNIHTFQISMYGASYLAGATASQCCGDKKALALLANDSDSPIGIARDGFLAGFQGECDVEYLADDWTGYIQSSLTYQKMGDWSREYGYIFPVAGGSNAGIYRYSRENEDSPFLAGMDIDQSGLSNKITGSVIKEIDRLIFEYLMEWSTTGTMPEAQLYGLESGYADWELSPLYETEYKDLMELIRQQAITKEQEYYEVN